MSLKISTIHLQDFSQESLTRSNFKTAVLGITIKKRLEKIQTKVVRIKDYFDIVNGFAFKSADYITNDGIPVIRIGDVGNDFDPNNMVYLPEEYAEEYERFLLKKEDIIIGLTGDGKMKSDIIGEDNKYLLNQRVGALRKKQDINLLFYYYLINYHSLVKDQFFWWSNGKTQLNISPNDFLKIKIPLIPLATQNEIVAQIKPIEDRIASLRNSIIPAQEIINRVFAREFGFDEHLHHEFGKGMTASTQQADDKTMRVFSIPSHELARSSIVRNSTRFHNPPTKKLMDLMDTMDTFYVYDVVSSYEKGIQPKYDTEGDIPVIKIGSLKNGYIDFSEPELVSQKFFDELDEKKKLKTGDIIICATGKGSLGKIDYYDYEQDAITAVDNYILRVDETKYNSLFFVYFFRSILGYFQIERDYTGATNQIHLYRDQISQFKIPNISPTEQQRIVDEITIELNNQTRISDAIAHERAKIDKIIEQAII